MSRFVPDWLTFAAKADPERLAIAAASGRWTNRELDDAADAMAAALAEGGTAEGSRVAALLSDDAPAVALIAAVRRLGAVLVPLNRRAARPELEYQLGVTKAAAVVHDQAHAARARELGAASRSPLHQVEALLVRSPHERSAAVRAEVDLDAAATIVFTSGTTGRPKAAVLSHGNHAASADAWAALLKPQPQDRWLACLPLFHVAGLAIVMRAGRWGVPLEIMDRFDAPDVAARIEAGVTHLSLVPTQLEQLLEVLGRPAPPATLRAILLGGGPVPIGTLERARAAGLPVLTTYGSTETGSGVAVGGAEAATLQDAAALRALPGVELRIAKPTDDVGIGPLLVRGAMVFRGYLDDPAATAERLRGGWLHTGDLGSLDAAGLLRIADRRDQLIISGGENVYPAEVEAVLLGHPDILDAAVLPQPHPGWGSVPVAAIVVAPGAAVSDAALEGYCRDRLAGYKVPVRFARLAGLPRNVSGKILRRELRDALSRDAPVQGGPLMPETTLVLTRPNARIAYRRIGAGPPLLLLHATLSSSRQLRPLAARLGARFDVLSVDRRGSGASAGEGDSAARPVDVGVHVDDLAALAETEELGACVVVGHSYGGCLGLELAARRPGLVRALWVFEPPFAPVAPAAVRDRMAEAARRTLQANEHRGPAAAAEVFMAAVSGRSAVAALTPAARERIGRAGSGAVADAPLLGLDAEGLRDIECPVAIAIGAASEPVYVTIAEGLQERIPGATIEHLEGVDHLAPLRRPDIIAAAVEAFVDR